MLELLVEVVHQPCSLSGARAIWITLLPPAAVPAARLSKHSNQQRRRCLVGLHHQRERESGRAAAAAEAQRGDNTRGGGVPTETLDGTIKCSLLNDVRFTVLRPFRKDRVAPLVESEG